MIEGLFLYFLWGKIADRVYAKGYDKTLKYQLLLILGWVAGEFLGVIVYVMATYSATGDNDYFMTYIAAFLGAFIGAGLVFWRISRLQQISMGPEEELDWRHKRVR